MAEMRLNPDVLELPAPFGLDPIAENFIDGCKPKPPAYETRKLTRNEVLDLMKHQLVLEYNIQKLGPNADPETKKALEVSAAAFRAMLEATAGFRLGPKMPTATSASGVNKVFDILELCEAILVHLTPKDLLAAGQVNRAFANTISGSQKVQKAMLLLSDPTAHCSTPVEWYENRNGTHYESHMTRLRATLMGIRCAIEGPGSDRPLRHASRVSSAPEAPSKKKCKVTVSFSENICYSSPPDFPLRVGARARRMLICSPPVFEMIAEPHCGWSCRHPICRMQQQLVTVKSETGITIGDLIDKAKELRQQHISCPYADVMVHNFDTGVVTAPVVFKGKVELEKSQQRSVSEKLGPWDNFAYEAHQAHWQTCQRRIQDFVAAKSAAFEAGQPMPLFEPFKEQWDKENDVQSSEQ